jgi:tetratricopeptide (TPR) repeat protein
MSSANANRSGRSDARRRAAPALTPEEIVGRKVSRFAATRLEIARAIARENHVELPIEVQRFFEVAQTGNWDEIQKAFERLKEARKDWPEGTQKVWGAVMETFGVAELAQEWPAQRLLDYGDAILDALRPDMVYVGGTDPGRFIPTLLNDTDDGEHHVILTQNALADGSYLDYLRFLYGDRLATLSPEDSQKCFSEYCEDAHRRYLHDQQFPNEPKQLLPAEFVTVDENGRLQVSGQIAVMGINERLLQLLMTKNPNLAFALEESFPLRSTHVDAAPLGPIMELRVGDEQQALTAQRAEQSLDYWRTTVQPLLADSGTPAPMDPRNAYAKMIVAQARLFLERNFNNAADQAFRLACELSPANPEVVFNYVNFLTSQNRWEEARQATQRATQLQPANVQFQDLLTALNQSRH